MTRIVGISLVKDEDFFVEQALRNVLGFCDELILADNRSRDGTPAILERLAAERPDKARLHRVDHPSESHDLIAGYAGRDVWVLGVDGDELYDPARLGAFRQTLLAGDLDRWWLVRGNAVHCDELATDRTTAAGWPSPPAPSMTKLHNFRLISSWDGRHPERLHGTEGLRFKDDAGGRKYELMREYSWEESPFRCLHLCFVARSSRERKAGARRNIPDMNAPRRLPLRAWTRLRELGGFPAQSSWKLEHYRRGERTEVSAAEFFARPA
jgi:glycosyltransferase involved in cell wall biosynthesis